MFLSVLVACVNPHRLAFAGALESALAVKFNRPSVSNERVLVKAIVARHEHLHQTPPDAAPLILWQHEQMRVVNNQITVSDGIAKSNEPLAIPSGHERMGRVQCLVQQLRPFC